MISIIIPTLNEESVLESTLAHLCSGLKNTRYEIIISDGGSGDRTKEIAQRYTDKIVVYQEKKRQTIAQARNMGADIASGDLLVFMDADVTIPDPDNFFKKTAKLFETRKNLLGLAVSLAVEKDKARLPDRVMFAIINANYALFNNVLHIGAAAGEFQMVRADAFKKLHGYREDLAAAEDNEFFYRLAKMGRTYVELKLIAYHSGRRIRKVGWPKLLCVWLINWFSMMLFKRSVSKEWKAIR